MNDLERLIKGNFSNKSDLGKEKKLTRLAIDYRIERQILNLLNANKYKFHSIENELEIHRSCNSRILKTLNIISVADEVNDIFYGQLDVFFLKGFYLTNCLYENRGLRPINDIDIYIKSSSSEEAYNKLLKNGFRKKDAPQMNSRYHLPALYSKIKNIKVDLHHSVFDIKLEEKKILKNSRQINLFGKKYNFLSNEINFMHIIFHGTKKENLDVGFQYLFDVKELVNQNLDWEEIRSLTMMLNMEKEVALTAELLFFYFKADIRKELNFEKPPDEIINASRAVLSSSFISTNLSKTFFKERFHFFEQVRSNSISNKFIPFIIRLLYLVKQYLINVLRISFNKDKLIIIKNKEKLYKFFNDAKN